MNRSIALLVGALVTAFVGAARSEEVKIPLKDVPKAAVDAVKVKFPHAKPRDEAEKEVDEGEVSYEISLLNEGKKITVEVTADGEIEEIETEIAVADLPKAVTDAIAKKFPGAELKRAEELVEFEDGEEEKSYEVVVAVGGKTMEVKVDPKGEIEAADED